MGAPFLGAPKSIRSVVSGDRLDLEVFLTAEEGYVFMHLFLVFFSLFFVYYWVFFIFHHSHRHGSSP